MRAHSLSHTHTHSLTHTHARTFTHAHTHIRTGAHARAPFAGNASGDDETVAKYLEIGEARALTPRPIPTRALLSLCVCFGVSPRFVCFFVWLVVCLLVCLFVCSANLRSGLYVCLWTAGHRRFPPREDRRAQVAAAAARAPIYSRASAAPIYSRACL